MDARLGPFRDVIERIRHPTRNARAPTICMYHAVSTETHEWGPWQFALTPGKFEQQIEWLSQHRAVVGLDTLVAYLRGEETLPENAVVLTFDDGYRNFVSQALPVLREYEVPATLYVSTALMSERATPYEFRLARTLQQSDEVTIRAEGREHTYRLTTAATIRDAYTQLRPVVEAVPAAQRASFLRRNEIAECPEFRIVAPETVRELAEEPLVTVGSHGHVHRRLRAVSRAESERDARRSQQRLAALLGRPPAHFSFPYGSHSRATRQAIEAVGFESAVTTESRLVRPRDWNRCYALPRIDMAANDGDIPDVLREHR